MGDLLEPIDEHLQAAAAHAGAAHGRDAAAQIAYWARIGQEIEARTVSGPVADVLAGTSSYDALADDAQTIVRAVWQARIHARVETLDLAAEFRAAGVPWVEADAQGNVVHRTPDDGRA